MLSTDYSEGVPVIEQDGVSLRRGGVFTRLLQRLFGIGTSPVVADSDDVRNRDAAVDKAYERMFGLPSTRPERYRVMRELDSLDLVASIVDLYTEEATQRDTDSGRTVWVESRAQHLIDAANECFLSVRIEDTIAALARRVVVEGDDFRRLIYASGRGVLGMIYRANEAVNRRSDALRRLLGFYEEGRLYRGPLRHPLSWPWDYLHVRTVGKLENEEYGTPIIANLLRPARQLALGEESVLNYRLNRAPDRNAILLDVMDMEDHEAEAYANTVLKRFRKHEFVDPVNADYRKAYNPLTPTEDVVIPFRGPERNLAIETLSGAGNMDGLFDLEHYRRKLLGAARVPAAYLGFADDVNAKATLLQQDVRFARTIKRLQRALVQGIRTLLEIHYALLDTDGKFDTRQKENQFQVRLAVSSFLEEYERLEMVRMRVGLVSELATMGQALQLNPREWSLYVLREYAKLPDEMIDKLVTAINAPPPGGETPGDLPGSPHHPRRFPREDKEVTGYMLNERERRLVFEALSRSPLLRGVVRDLRAYAEIDQAQQAPPDILLPNRSPGGVVQLSESLDALAGNGDSAALIERASYDELLAHMESMRGA